MEDLEWTGGLQVRATPRQIIMNLFTLDSWAVSERGQLGPALDETPKHRVGELEPYLISDVRMMCAVWCIITVLKETMENISTLT